MAVTRSIRATESQEHPQAQCGNVTGKPAWPGPASPLTSLCSVLVIRIQGIVKKPACHTHSNPAPARGGVWSFRRGLTGAHSISLKHSRDFTELNSFVLHIIPVELVSLNGEHLILLPSLLEVHPLDSPSKGFVFQFWVSASYICGLTLAGLQGMRRRARECGLRLPRMLHPDCTHVLPTESSPQTSKVEIIIPLPRWKH